MEEFLFAETRQEPYGGAARGKSVCPSVPPRFDFVRRLPSSGHSLWCADEVFQKGVRVVMTRMGHVEFSRTAVVMFSLVVE